jgi:hypothetical protein
LQLPTITPGGFGSITLPTLNPPTLTFERGFYFDGLLNRLDITGLVINGAFTVNTWLKYVREADVGINPIFNLDTAIPDLALPAFNVFFETSTGLLNRLKLHLKI